MNIGLQHEIPGARWMVEMTENSVKLPYFRHLLNREYQIEKRCMEKIIFNKMCSKSTAILRNAHAPT